MTVVYVKYKGESVSREWGIILRAADAANVDFTLLEGHRTWARQDHFWAGSPNNPNRTWRGNLAAKPSHTAPHIRTGRIDHALDVNQLDGGVFRLAAFIRRHGGRVIWEVNGELWHIYVPAEDLIKIARKLARKPDPFKGFLKDEKRWLTEYVKLLDDKRRGKDSKAKRKRRTVLRRYMTRRRQRIWRSANGRYKGVRAGWNRETRRKRYATLKHYT